MNCHRDSLEMAKSSRDGSGTVVSALPMRKCPGVSAEMSSGSSLSGSRGHEFRIASIWVSRVVVSSKVSKVSPMVRRRWYLSDFTTASHLPPMCGADGGLKFL